MLDIIVGGQFGSEAKGHVTKRVIERRLREGAASWIVNMRVAGPNAGHCVRDEAGNKFALRTIPVGAVFNSVMLAIAPGSEIELQVLLDEVALLEEAGHNIRGRLWVSPEATILTDQHKVTETGMQERMGSTGKGIGAARADRIMRTAQRVQDNPSVVETLERIGAEIGFPSFAGSAIVIEGTQGYGLGLHAGFYPQCTSSDTRAIDFAAMAGVNPWEHDDFNIYVVARVYPIRVAGNSGPLKGEMTWEELGLPQEFTTVTKKVRRVGEWDAELVRAAVVANGPSKVRLALTMLDQKFGGVQGMTNEADVLAFDGVPEFLDGVEFDAGARVHLVTTGEDTGAWVR